MTAPLIRSAPPPSSRGDDGLVARVMICDDSMVIRGVIARMLADVPGIEVVARVSNGRNAIEELKKNQIDVIVLDIEMPVMDGLTALPLLLEADPGVRVVMASTLTTRGADIAMRALRLGAADYVPKPSASEVHADDIFRRELIEKIRGLARLRHRAAIPALKTPASPPVAVRAASPRKPKLLAIGSSTGGPHALFILIPALGRDFPAPVVVTQHMPAAFTKILASHISGLGGMPCEEAADGSPLRAGHIYLAPGDHHLLVGAEAGGLVARVTSDPPENFCRPAVDPMLRSATRATGGQMLMLMLTGMGHDGLAATRGLIEAGGQAIAQDEASSVVWGMPGAVAREGLCSAVLPLGQIAAKVKEIFGKL